MSILPLHPELEEYLKKHRLLVKFQKQIELFKNNPFHPGLHTELLEPRYMKIWSFRIDKKFRAIFIFLDKSSIEIIDINNHYA
jgi:Txe/YoeB family toxin of Txe-Axe toxin-antitoxin module